MSSTMPSLPFEPEAPFAQSRRGVEFVEMGTKQILNRCTSPRMPFTWTINPYRGCEFGCVYCYARYTHEFLELRDPMDFERRIFVKRRAAEVLERTLARTNAGLLWIYEKWIKNGSPRVATLLSQHGMPALLAVPKGRFVQ